MEKNNLGKKIILGGIILILLVIGAVIIVNGISKNTESEMEAQNTTNMITDEVQEDVPVEEVKTQMPTEEKQVGVGE